MGGNCAVKISSDIMEVTAPKGRSGRQNWGIGTAHTTTIILFYKSLSFDLMNTWPVVEKFHVAIVQDIAKYFKVKFQIHMVDLKCAIAI